MNNDGWGQMGAGQDDMRVAGHDLQHYKQKLNASGSLKGHNIAQHSIHEALEMERHEHKEAKKMRVKHLEDHYKR